MEKTVSLIANEILACKGQQKQLSDRIAELNEELAKYYDCEMGKSKTHNFDGFKVVVKRPINVKADLKGMVECDANTKPIIQKATFDPKGLEWIKTHDPDSYAIVSPFVTSTAGKLSVTLSKVAE